MVIKPIFRWYDLWVGVFIDRPNHRVYIFPIPCFGIRIQWRKVEYTFADAKYPNLFTDTWPDRIPDGYTPGSYYLKPDTIEDDL